MAEQSVSTLVWLAQSAPLVALLCYVGYQWRNLLSCVLVIAALYSFTKNIINLLIDSHKLPKSAFPIFLFFDIWMALTKLSNLFLDVSYVRMLLDGIMKRLKTCPTTNITIHKVNKDLDVYVYKPETVSNKGCVVYIHGGGWCFLSAAGFSGSVSYMAHYLEMVVVSVEYRLAPEHPFPAGLEDCYSAVQWVQDNCEMLEVDAESVFVGGDSAGGNLSAAVCMLYRDRQGAPLETAEQSTGSKKGPGIAGQILLYPVLQGFSNCHSSMLENSSYFPPPDEMPRSISLYACGNERFSEWLGDPLKIPQKAPKFWKTFVCKAGEGPSDLCTIKEVKKLARHADNATLEEILGNSYIFPLHAEDVRDLPPAYVQVAAADPLHDEGEWYARYLEESGNTVVFSVVKHCHGFMMKYHKNVYARNELMKIKEFIGQQTKAN